MISDTRNVYIGDWLEADGQGSGVGRLSGFSITCNVDIQLAIFYLMTILRWSSIYTGWWSVILSYPWYHVLCC